MPVASVGGPGGASRPHPLPYALPAGAGGPPASVLRQPELYSAAVGHHFGRPGNRIWPTLHAAGFTPRRLQPADERELLALGYRITNVARRASAAAAELADAELVAGGKRLRAKLKRYAPRFLALLGVVAYRGAFGQPKARVGLQDKAVGGTRGWVLPNPSGLNAHYQAADLARVFA